MVGQGVCEMRREMWDDLWYNLVRFTLKTQHVWPTLNLLHIVFLHFIVMITNQNEGSNDSKKKSKCHMVCPWISSWFWAKQEPKKTDQKHSLLNPQATDRVPQRAVWGAVIRSDTSDGYDGSIQCPQVSVLCALVHLHLYLHLLTILLPIHLSGPTSPPPLPSPPWLTPIYTAAIHTSPSTL